MTGAEDMPADVREYLTQHGIHDLVNDMAHALLTQKPRKPREFLAAFLAGDPAPVPPPAPPAKAPAPPPPAPPAKATPAPPPAPAKAPAPPPAPTPPPPPKPSPPPPPAKPDIEPAPSPAPAKAPAPPASEAPAEGVKKKPQRLREDDDWIELWDDAKGKAYYQNKATKKKTYKRAETTFTTEATPPPDAAARSASVQSAGSGKPDAKAGAAKPEKIVLRECNGWVEYWLPEKQKAYYVGKGPDGTKKSTYKQSETPFEGDPPRPS
eukprot:TRINITY_DN8053_c0_g1_i1.p1 TRINITY_DN8053_c0_g1~~TRINITY_DN8053_c0_g1_i1.p1  ORF type:complete len:282 (+),score=80.59 TRINITY_DN8053_c0_g1_i1:50-847(+)